MAICGDSSTTAIVPFLLTEDNYEDWRIYMKNYLLAQDLWGIIESGDDVDLPYSSNDVRNLRKKNAAALHAIHTTSSSDIFAYIKMIESAKDAWNILAQLHLHRRGSDGGEEDEVHEDSRCVQLKKSICNGDWNAVKQFFVIDRSPLNTTMFSGDHYTALHAAIQAGHDKITEELVEMMSVTDLEIKSGPVIHEDTVLSLVAWTGSTHVAKCIVEKNRNLLTIENGDGRIPVTAACHVGQKEMTYYFYSETPARFLAPRNGYHGFHLIRSAIANKMLDICYDLLCRHPSLTTKMTLEEDSPIYMLSLQPSAFLSGSRLRFWQRWIYHWLEVKLPPTSSGELRIPIIHNQELNEMEVGIQGFSRPCGLGLMFQNFFGITHIYDLKLTHLWARKIICCMCDYVSTLKIQHPSDPQVRLAMFEATRQGIVEFVIELLKVIQPLICFNKDHRDVFMVAIQYRQENIFNLFYGIHEVGKAQILCNKDRNENNMLHVAGERAPDFQLVRISSPALQMQRELQWYKEVERIAPEWCKEAKNRDDETPYEVLSKTHKKLVEKGAKWMKDTASSFLIVGTLIVTILFAAAFTLPGGNDQSTGFPIFLWKRSFMIFIISDAISFFAASTSVLMFLGILPSRFAMEDFLESLPRKLIIGLSTLFISIAAMMVSFSAALLIILQDRWWAIIPIIMMASIPVTLFVWLQFPLLVEIFVSTYAPGIFHRKMKPWLHCRAS